ncbi:type II toxin-antitoxin system death-on-curing family toxin [Entomobacter blattae]|uniref:Fic/DOC family protein n=1 Tax=Entomobacter blattae TaxID=2762277 RepID=A0A7H1NTS6_9PROT|nr:type II toxin-antitoxin system death-on-curing family toxin [Entomobacter blattae]QNT79186.1 Fic/DOC family protein [Entomobacter blattae]
MTPLWLEESDILPLHEKLLALNGGAEGIRDTGLLQSALTRPKNWWHYNHTAKDAILHMANLYTAGIIGNHPFIDGNKRTGFITGILFLELNGFDFFAPEEIATRAVLSLAASSQRSTEGEKTYFLFLKEYSKKAELHP